MADEQELTINQTPPKPKKDDCDCKPGLPGWMATFADMVTLLLTFFVLLLSFAKTETSKMQAALGSIRNAFGGASLQQGEVIIPGKSPDDQPTMMDTQEPVKPFPIEFLTTEGLLDKQEINRPYENTLRQAKESLRDHGLSDSVDVYEVPEDIKMEIADKIYFETGIDQPRDLKTTSYEKVVSMLRQGSWQLFVQGYASKNERGGQGQDAYTLSMQRAVGVAQDLMKRGVDQQQITIVAYGDSRLEKFEGMDPSAQEEADRNQKVDFVIRKTDLKAVQKKVDHR